MGDDPLRVPEYLGHIVMRNRVSHGYFTVDLEIVWKTIKRDIPELEEQAKRLLAGLAADGAAADAGGPW